MPQREASRNESLRHVVLRARDKSCRDGLLNLASGHDESRRSDHELDPRGSTCPRSRWEPESRVVQTARGARQMDAETPTYYFQLKSGDADVTREQHGGQLPKLEAILREARS